MPRAQKGFTDGLRRDSAGTLGGQGGKGGQETEWDVVQLLSQEELYYWSGFCIPYCSDVAVVLCQLRHIRTSLYSANV